MGITLTVMTVSCEKENNNNVTGTHLRITKIADNQAMENPWYNFKYNSKNLLVNISSEDQYSSFNSEIIYNASNQPIKISTTSYYLGRVEGINITNIQWNKNGFVISDEDDLFNEIDTYELDSKGRVVKLTNIFTPQGSTPQTSIITANWVGEESMNIPAYSNNYKYTKKNNPFININLAVIIGAELEYAEWEQEFQNSFCISEYQEPAFTAGITYQYNDQNLPIRADIKYTSEEGIDHEYIYFEYESY
jgi:hypothetical protein